jgi:two-component system, NarL family, nitrate/nitrite response regulator NarL
MVSSPISIVIADDHPVLTMGLRGLLEIEPDLRVVGHANNAADVIQRVLELKPDILLLDLRMPLQREMKTSDRGGLQAWEAVKGIGCRTKAILFAAEMETQQIVDAIELGVRGVLLKSAATELLIDGIRAVMRGACWEQTKTVPTFQEFLKTKHEELAKRTFGLTPRELDVVSAIALHEMSNKDIARFFDIAEDTVKKHVTSIYDKTGVSSRLELARFAREHKLPIKNLF